MARRRARERLVTLVESLATVPLRVWSITALFAVLLIGWTQLTPLAQAPDEAGHAALIERIADGRSYPDYDEFRPYESAMRGWVLYRPGWPTRGQGEWLTPENAPARQDRSTHAELGGRRPWSHNNQLSQHPPLYYGAMGGSLGLLRALPGGDRSLDREWHLLRLLNVALVAPLPLLAWATARRLGAGDTAATVAALVPLAIPQLLHIGSSINNDNLLILSGAVLSWLLAGVLRGDRRWRTAVAVGTVAGLALWTKAPAFLLLPWIAVAYSVPALGRQLNGGSRWAPQLLRLGAAAATTALVGSWWWVRNLLRHGELSPSILDDPAFAPPDTIDIGVAAYVERYIPTVVHRFWGNFGSYQAPLTPALVVAATVAVALCILASFWPRRPEGEVDTSGPSKRHLAGLLVLLPFLAAAAFGFAYRALRSTGIMAAMQGRYLFGGLVPIATAVGIGATRAIGPRAPLVVLVSAVLMQFDAVRAALRAFWAEPDASVGRSMSAMSAWSTWPVALQAGWLAALAGLLISTGWLMTRPASQQAVSAEAR